MKSKPKSLFLGACLALSVAFTGCATTGGTVDPNQAKIVAKTAVSVLVVEMVAKDPAKAVRVAALAHEVKAAIGTDGFNTVDLIMALVRSKIDLSGMQPATQILVGVALDQIGLYLHGVAGSGVIPADKIVYVAEVAGWVEDAAKLVIPPVSVPPSTPPAVTTP